MELLKISQMLCLPGRIRNQRGVHLTPDSVVQTWVSCGLHIPLASYKLYLSHLSLLCLSQYQRRQSSGPCSQQQEENIGVRLDISDSSSGQQMVPTDGSSSSSLREPGRSSELPTCMDSEMGYRDQESIVLHIETHSEIWGKLSGVV